MLVLNVLLISCPIKYIIYKEFTLAADIDNGKFEICSNFC